MPCDSPHCANSSAADNSLLCVRDSPRGEAKLKRSTVSNMSNLRWVRHRLQESGKVRKQRAVDYLDAGPERVNVIGEQRQVRRRDVGGGFESEAVVLQHFCRVGEVIG